MSHECNRYISDVPMRFTDRFLSRIIDESSLMKYDEIEDMSRFHVPDYKFDAELFAIETFELHKRSVEDKQKLEAETRAQAASQPLSGNTLLRQIVSAGQILTPVPVTPLQPTQHSHQSTHQSNAHPHSTYHQSNNCDPSSSIFPSNPLTPLSSLPSTSSSLPLSSSSSSPYINNNNSYITTMPSSSSTSTTLTNGQAIRPINPNDFDNNEYSPFDTLELKTINEREELTKLFQTMNNVESSTTNNGTFGTYPKSTNPFL